MAALPSLSRIGMRRIVLAGIALALGAAIALGVFHRDIDVETATRVADRMLVQYSRGNGEPGRNFSPRETRIWADGWEFRWRYQPCPEFASLRIWISRDGRSASFAEMPDCAPESGFAVKPLKV